jgi:hypothetical protein
LTEDGDWRLGEFEPGGVGGLGLKLAWVSQGRKFFFSEEKKQKTFSRLSRFYPAAYANVAKVFWFFFSKKNALLFHRAAECRVCRRDHPHIPLPQMQAMRNLVIRLVMCRSENRLNNHQERLRKADASDRSPARGTAAWAPGRAGAWPLPMTFRAPA